MEKRYQVFISSTKEDLEDARSEVSQALLRANCFPAAMELFPAADEGIDDYIKQKIDESDYMVLIVAGRYGSVNPITGISYTEEEYDYAVLKDKPVVRLVHKSPFETLPGSKIEQEPERREKLVSFRDKVTTSHVARMWESDRELGAEVVLGILDAQQRHPSSGWIPADNAATRDALEKILSLEKEKQELERVVRDMEDNYPELNVEYPIFMESVAKIPEVSAETVSTIFDYLITRSDGENYLEVNEMFKNLNNKRSEISDNNLDIILRSMNFEKMISGYSRSKHYLRVNVDKLIEAGNNITLYLHLTRST